METIRKENGSNIETMSIHATPAFPVNSLLSVQYFGRTPSIARTNKPPTVCVHTSNRIEPSHSSTPDTPLNPIIPSHPVPSHSHSLAKYLPTSPPPSSPSPSLFFSFSFSPSPSPSPSPSRPQIRARQSKQPFLSRPVSGISIHGLVWNGLVWYGRGEMYFFWFERCWLGTRRAGFWEERGGVCWWSLWMDGG